VRQGKGRIKALIGKRARGLTNRRVQRIILIARALA
jgi:hypothetical protein